MLANSNINITLPEIKMCWGNTKYESWNTTHIQHLWIALLEETENSDTFKELMECFRKFIEWRNLQPDEYFPATGLETMYSKAFLKELYQYFEKYNPTENVNESKKEFIMELIEKHDKPRMMTQQEIANIQKQFVYRDINKNENLSLYKKVVSWLDEHPFITTTILVMESVTIGYMLGVSRERCRK